MENEIMNEEIMEPETETCEVEEESRIGTGVAMLIGAGLTLATTAVVKLAKKGIAAYKAKKELRRPEEPVEVDDDDIVDVAK